MQAYNTKLYGPSYQWLHWNYNYGIQSWLSNRGSYDGDREGHGAINKTNNRPRDSCTPQMMRTALEGTITFRALTDVLNGQLSTMPTLAGYVSICL